MAEQQLDCRGLACPAPVLNTKEVVDRGEVDRLTVLVDNYAARENVSRFLNRSGYQVSVAEEDGAYAVTGFRSEQSGAEPAPEAEGEAAPEQKILVLVGTDRMGTGDDVLGRKLIESFVATLKEMHRELWRLVLLNAGVKLTIDGSPVLDALRELENDGVHLLVCGTCLGHFGLLDQKQVGETTNMLDIVTSLQLADKVISIT